MLSFCSFVCIVALVHGEAHVSVQNDCGSHGATINDIYIDQCTSMPCAVKKGADYTVHVNFTATDTFMEAHNVLHGGLGFLQVPFPLNPENACTNSVPCPIQKGQTYLYTQTMTCPSYAPSIHVTAKWEVKDEHHRDIFCFNVKLSIHS